MIRVDLSDFSGGLNLRDSLEQLARNETPDALNVTLTTRGQARTRPGCFNAVALPGDAGARAHIYYSPGRNQWLCVRKVTGAPTRLKLFTRPGDLSGSWTDRGVVGNPPAAAYDERIPFVDFPSGTTKVVLSGPDIANGGGIFTWDGTTLANVSTSISARGLAVWQNRVWALGSTMVLYSAIGDPTAWNVSTQLNNLFEKDAAILTGVGLAGGALIVFKERSAYRIHDSNTGAYSTIDTAAGCIYFSAVADVRGRLYTWGRDGLYEWDGIGRGRPVGDKILPLFSDSAIATDPVPPLIAAGVSEGRVVWAYPSVAAGNNDRLLEYDPTAGWLMKHELPVTQNEVSSFAVKNSILYAAVTDGDDLLRLFTETPGADDGSNYTSYIKTPPLNLGGLHRLQRLRLYGKGSIADTSTKEVGVAVDLSTSFNNFDVTSALEVVGKEETFADLRSLGHGEGFQVLFRTSAGTGRTELNRIILDLVPLAR